MGPAHFDLVSHWRLTAPLPPVWDALVRLDDWPTWWPQLRSVTLLRPGAPNGLGRAHRIAWRTGLGYPLVLELEAVEVVRHERLRGRAHGHLDGEGLWLLAADGCHTHVTYVWRVQLRSAWMRRVAPLMAPLFRWNHARLMQGGGLGLARHLGLRPGDCITR